MRLDKCLYCHFEEQSDEKSPRTMRFYTMFEMAKNESHLFWRHSLT